MYISDMISFSSMDKKKFNLIASGTGTGKTFFVAKNIKNYMKGVLNSEILFIASRSLIIDQQSKEPEISKYNQNDQNILGYWNGKKDKIRELRNYGIQIMTYDKLIDILINKNDIGLETLSGIKVVVFDECHTLFSDTFIHNMEVVKVWVRDTLYNGQKTIIGMTATPNIIKYYQDTWGVEINQLNDEILVKYKAKQLYCTNFETIPYIVTTQLEGRSIIMCYSYADCLKLQKQIPDSFVLISKSNEDFTGEMKRVRDFIVMNEKVPETYVAEDGTEKQLNVLITTSTMREGINLREDGTLKNIVCCFSDELHITQFAGRARYNLDNLVVADTYIRNDNAVKEGYLKECRDSYKKFMTSKESLSWFDSISHLVEHDVVDVKKFALNSEEAKFVEYINERWLVPADCEDNNKYRIYKEEDKNEIINKAIQCRLLKLYHYQITFNKILNFMKNVLGYMIEEKKSVIEYRSYRYKLVADYDKQNDWHKRKDTE